MDDFTKLLNEYLIEDESEAGETFFELPLPSSDCVPLDWTDILPDTDNLTIGDGYSLEYLPPASGNLWQVVPAVTENSGQSLPCTSFQSTPNIQNEHINLNIFEDSTQSGETSTTTLQESLPKKASHSERKKFLWEIEIEEEPGLSKQEISRIKKAKYSKMYRETSKNETTQLAAEVAKLEQSRLSADQRISDLTEKNRKADEILEQIHAGACKLECKKALNELLKNETDNMQLD